MPILFRYFAVLKYPSRVPEPPSTAQDMKGDAGKE